MCNCGFLAHDVDQISCPGCKDRFLLPTSFYHHLYRRSVMITFTCGPCGDATMTFYNKCHLRVHVLTHLEADGLASVSVVQPGMPSLKWIHSDQMFWSDIVMILINNIQTKCATEPTQISLIRSPNIIEARNETFLFFKKLLTHGLLKY